MDDRPARLPQLGLMRSIFDRISKWRVWTYSGPHAFLVLFGAWFGLGWVLAPVSDVAYLLSILIAFIGPTALFCFLFLRHWMLRAEYSKRDGLSRRLGCIFACGVTTLLAVQTAFDYYGMTDAPRGLLWDINVCISSLLGMITFLLVRVVVYPRSVVRV
jgi:hypothetical protein